MLATREYVASGERHEMTPYSYTITLAAREMIALTSALAHYMAECERELADGMEVPFWAHREAIKDIRSKLFDQINTPGGTYTKEELDAMAWEAYEAR
jgi:hypothetical protein